MDKTTYQSEQARTDLANLVMDTLVPLVLKCQDAKLAELSYAPNETVNTADFDNLMWLLNGAYDMAARIVRQHYPR